MHNLLIEKKNIDMTEIAVVDIETTSLKPFEGSIIEIGIDNLPNVNIYLGLNCLTLYIQIRILIYIKR